MIKSATIFIAAAALALPSIASAANSSPAASLSLRSAQAVQPVRASAPRKNESQLQGSGIILAILAAAAVIGGIVIATDGNNDDVSA